MEVKMKDITPIDKSSLLNDACNIIEQAQATAYRQVNETLIKRNWLLGMRIRHEVLKDERAEYGEQVVKMLANVLTNILMSLHHCNTNICIEQVSSSCKHRYQTSTVPQ